MNHYTTTTYDRLNLERLTKNLEQLRHAQEMARSGEYDAEPELMAEMFDSLEGDVAAALAEVVGDATNVLSQHQQDLLAQGFARLHPTLLANVLRAVLAAYERHPNDGRLPEWVRTGGNPVPTV